MAKEEIAVGEVSNSLSLSKPPTEKLGECILLIDDSQAAMRLLFYGATLTGFPHASR